MKKPFAELDPATIDDYIEQTEQQLPQQPDSEDARYLRDLHYLHRKEEILQRAARRLQLVETTDEKIVSLSRPGETGTLWSEQSNSPAQPRRAERRRGFAWSRLVAVLAAILLLLGALVGTSQFFRSRSQQILTHPGSIVSVTRTTGITKSTVLFSDPLSQNIHNWPVDSQHFFKNGSYHLSVKGAISTSALLPRVSGIMPWSYSLTMTQVLGNPTAPVNSFGMIFAYTQTKANGLSIDHFYTLEFVGQDELFLYQYDNTRTYPWSAIWSTKLAFGQRLGEANTLKVMATATALVITLNGKTIGNVAHLPLESGQFGMFVTLRGAEIAFQNMLITRP